MMPRRIVMLYSLSFQPDQGWYRRVYNEAKALVEDGHDVTLLAWDRECQWPEDEVRDGIRIHRFRLRAGLSQGPRKNGVKHLRFSRWILSYLRRCEFDVVHCFNVDTMLPGLLAARWRKRRAVLDLCEPEYYRGFWNRRCDWLVRGIGWMEKTLARRFDHLFVHNTYQIEKFRACGISRITQVGSYPNRSMLAADLDRPQGETVVIGRLGSIYANNGYEEVVAAFRKLLDRRSQARDALRFRLRLAGNVFDRYRPAFEALVGPLGENIDLSGVFDVSELPQLYRQIDISLLLYGKGPFGNVTPTKLFESMACGVPVVANAVGDMGTIVAEGPCGVIVDESDPESICDGIERLACDGQLRRAMAANAVRLARERYTWEAVQPAFLESYRAL